MNCKIGQLVISPESKTGPMGKIILSQPSFAEEDLLGRLFIITEIQSRRNDNLVLLDFIANAMNQNYYSAEQLAYIEKGGVITVESIFETAITKLNKQIADFFQSNHLVFSPGSINLTIGVSFQNKLFFSSVGTNRGFLIYEPKSPDSRSIDGYSLLNIAEKTSDPTREIFNPAKLFNDTMKGNIPQGAAFVFANEALSEFFTEKQIIKIISTLPPAGAAKQFHNIIEQSQLFVPFLALIIKNSKPTVGAEVKSEHPSSVDMAYRPTLRKEMTLDTGQQLHPLSVAKMDRQAEPPKIAKDINKESIKALNRTEEKTAQILRPSGLVSLKTLKKLLNQINFQRFLKKDKITIDRIVSKRQARQIFTKIWSNSIMVFSYIANISLGVFHIIKNKEERNALIDDLKAKRKTLKPTHWALLALILIAIVFFGINIVNISKKKAANLEEKQFADIKTTLDSKFQEIEVANIYGNNEQIKALLKEISDKLSALPEKNDVQKNYKKEASAKFQRANDQINHIVRTDNPDKFNWPVSNASFFTITQNKLAVVSGQNLLLYDLKNNKDAGNINLGIDNCRPLASDINDNFWCISGSTIISVNLSSKAITKASVKDFGETTNIGAIWNNKLYATSNDKQIYKLIHSGAEFNNKKAWTKNPFNLEVKDLAIDGQIYLLGNDKILKYSGGDSVNINLESANPPIQSASYLALGTGSKLAIIENTGRILVYNNAGKLESQFISDAWRDAKGLKWTLDGKNLLILTSNQIYKSPTIN